MKRERPLIEECFSCGARWPGNTPKRHGDLISFSVDPKFACWRCIDKYGYWFDVLCLVVGGDPKGDIYKSLSYFQDALANAALIMLPWDQKTDEDRIKDYWLLTRVRPNCQSCATELAVEYEPVNGYGGSKINRAQRIRPPLLCQTCSTSLSRLTEG